MRSQSPLFGRVFSRVNYAALFVASCLFGFSAPSQAQSLSISFNGNVLNCSDTSKNESFNFSFSTSGQTDGNDTLVTLALGGSLGSFNVPIPTSQIQSLTQAVSSSGGSISISFGPEPLGPPGCDIQGSLVISLGSGALISANAPGSVATASAQVSSFLRTAIPAISNRVGNVFRGTTGGLTTADNVYSISGMAAGNGSRPPIGAWAGYSYSDSSNNFSSVAFKSDRHTVLLGLDTMLSKTMLIGISASLERAEIETRFNGGEQSVTAISLTPYIGMQLTDWLTVDAALGIGSVSTDQFRTAGGARITSDLDSTRIYGSINASATRAFGQIILSGHTGLLYATQKDDAFRESNNSQTSQARSSVGRFLFGGELAYSAGAWEPYVSGTFEYDITHSSLNFAPGVAVPREDDTDLLVAIGMRYFGDDNVSASMEYSSILGRRNVSDKTLSANVRWQF